MQDQYFSLAYYDLVMSNGFKLKKSKFRIRFWKFFTLRVMGHWKTLFRAAVDAAPSLEVGWGFKQYGLIEGVLCLWWQGWNWVIVQIPSIPKHSVVLGFCDLVLDGKKKWIMARISARNA